MPTDPITAIPSDEIRRSKRPGATGWTKFGFNPNVVTAGSEIIWANDKSFTPMTTADTFTITYDQTQDGSDANGAKLLAFFYIDADGLPQLGVHTLGNTGSDTTTFQGLGINRIAASLTGSTGTNGGEITVTETTGGGQQAIIPAGEGVTQQAIFFCGSQHEAVVKMIMLNINKISGGGSPRVTVIGWVYNRPVATQFEVFRYTMDTGVENQFTLQDPVGFRLSPGDVLWFESTTTVNNTVVNMRFSLIEYEQNS